MGRKREKRKGREKAAGKEEKEVMQSEKEGYGCWNYKIIREWEKDAKGRNERDREKERWQMGR